MLLVCFLIALLGHVLFWVEFNNRTHGIGWPHRLVDILTITSGIVFFAAPLYAIYRIMFTESLGGMVSWYGYFCMACAVLIVFWRMSFVWDPNRDKNVFLLKTDIYDLNVKTSCMESLEKVLRHPWNEALKPHFEHREHPIDNLPKELEGFRIAHLTDFHLSGRIGIEYFLEVTQLVNDLKPDLICLTGDLVERTDQLEWVDRVFGELESKYGTYFILGNHDGKIDPQAVRNSLNEAGLIDVGGRHLTIETETGNKIVLCGDERPWFDAEAAPLPEIANSLTLGLIHSPDRFAWAIENRVQLALAGHNHGGQVCFPFFGPLLCPSKHGVRYAEGSFHKEQTAMHVSRGTSALFPIRFLCPPEVGLITLKQRKPIEKVS